MAVAAHVELWVRAGASHKHHRVVALGGPYAIAPEIRGPVVPAGQTAVVVDVPVLGHVDPQHVLTLSHWKQGGLLGVIPDGA